MSTDVGETHYVYRLLVYKFREFVAEHGLDTQTMEEVQAWEFADWLTPAGSDRADIRAAAVAAYEALQVPEEDQDIYERLVLDRFRFGWMLRVTWPSIVYSSRHKCQHIPSIVVDCALVFEDDGQASSVGGIVLPPQTVTHRVRQELSIRGLEKDGAIASLLIASGEQLGKVICQYGIDGIYEGKICPKNDG